MANLLDYAFQLEPYAESFTGNGVWVFPSPITAGTATCGVVGSFVLPALTAEGIADWKSFGVLTLPALSSTGSANGYCPAWGGLTLPGLTCEGTAHVVVESQCLLPPLFAVGYTGVTGELRLPAMTAYGIDNSFNATASGALSLPAFTVTGFSYACDLDKPIANGATSAAVVNLLQQGNVTLADAALSLTSGCVTDDARALALVRAIANLLVYSSDGDGIGDRWSCALVTWLRRYGDCEDGAILIHSLLLAAGVNPNRIRTAFGTVLSASLTEVGHAWCMYRREVDEEWIPLDWTFGAAAYSGAIRGISRQIDLTETYTAINYILTHEAFYAVNDANYFAKLAKITTSGALALPALGMAATTGIVAWGALELFKGLLGSTITATGHTGAMGGMTLPVLRAEGTASQANVARGEWIIPALEASGGTGAGGALVLPRLEACGRCGVLARGDISLPLLALSGSAMVHAFAVADLLLPALVATGTARVGDVMAGVCALPALVATGRASQGPLARGDLMLPRLVATGQAFLISDAMGDWKLPALAARGRARNAPSWAVGVLEYIPGRW